MTNERALSALEISKRRVAEKVRNYYTQEQTQLNAPEFNARQARTEAAEQCFKSEIEELSTDPKYDVFSQEMRHAQALLAEEPVMEESILWSSLLSRIGQQFRLPPEDRDLLLKKYFPLVKKVT